MNNCQHCGSEPIKRFAWAYKCGSQDAGRYPYQSNECQLRSSIIKLESERDALKQNRDEWRKLAEMLIELQSDEFPAGGEAMIDKQRDASDLYRKLKEVKPWTVQSVEVR